ncbi:MAG: nucleotidyltransferase family protein [Terrimicrobiaceae bacterium]|nr:nucleotidyltransferase family protein [Terrimicrobiaceae bacterium]
MSPFDLTNQLGEQCKRHSVKRLQIFGSASRGEENSASDVDLLVHFEDMPPGEYARHYFELLHELEDTFGRSVDLVTPGFLKRPSLKRNIQKEAVILYEAGG